jgi:hypothetical protein
MAEYDDETGEWVVSCPSCGAEIRTDSQTEAMKYALYAGKTCEQCNIS